MGAKNYGEEVTHTLLLGREKSILLLDGSQAMPARPSDND
jgi:hypothetical protein